MDPTATAVTPYLVSEYERITYYHGISLDPPELLYRSDLLHNPFPLPKVAPQICSLLKGRRIRYSAVMAARFFTHGEDGEGSLGPIVIWISTHPGTTTAENAHDASPDIISLLEEAGVKGAVVEWYEGSVETLAGPPLLRVILGTDPPITEDDDAQGSVALFFHENKTEHSQPSARVLGTNTADYLFKGRGVNEIKALIGVYGSDAEHLATEIAALEQHLESNDPDEVEEAEAGVPAKQAKLAEIKQNIGVLEDFYNDVNAQWSDIERRNLGHVDWAPMISVDVEGKRYTLDLGTFELDEAKFKDNFKGNVIDLGCCSSTPPNRQLRIKGIVAPQLLANPDGVDSNGEPCLVVLKDGGKTDVTVGKYAGLEAYVADDLGQESIELAIYNYDKQSGDFSAKGDSGALIVDGLGNMVGIPHSGMPKGASNHVMFATPAWWAVEKIKEQYPYADFYRTGW
ncbi:hypothetical protein HYPSUDRAFT_62237 [Hypholoma sublateritium FD-334 SS-4]|uniref:Uncharacterized protein n=1 Tax=Hypholoma sublateritium (strain FD-334 SS-4) TaxID=945553 RepID=A0A0D2LL49_HYPSF|nr:hypothetical protein HYPSUDRAFT_62237 [Hypholoma sublateritium FD-334 SS-4]